jgi:hypothetical protein
VITVTDKAQNNILFTCKYFYISKVKEELNSPVQMTYQAANIDQASINDHIVTFSRSKGIKVPDNMLDIPLIYWIPKMHKNPIGSRFIAGSKLCSIKLLSKNFSKALKYILNHMKNYNRVVFERSQLNQYWILENSLEFLDNIQDKILIIWKLMIFPHFTLLCHMVKLRINLRVSLIKFLKGRQNLISILVMAEHILVLPKIRMGVLLVVLI